LKHYSFLNYPELIQLESVTEESGRRQYILPDGSSVPSVTTVLSAFKSDYLEKWRYAIGHEEANRITQVAASRGSRFHALMEAGLFNREIDTKRMMPDMKEFWIKVRPLVERIDNIHYIETTLYSELLRVAGRCDVIAEFDGIGSIIDFKTSRDFKEESMIQNYFEQETCYSLLYEEMTGRKLRQIVTIMVGPGAPQLFVKQRNPYIDSLYEKIFKYHKMMGSF